VKVESILVGCSPAIRAIRVEVARAARARAGPVVILGPTGSGKERVAALYHAAGGFPGRLVAVNAASRDGDLVNDDLFGHARGAYSGATESRAGLIAAARDGVLFLDEIGGAPASFLARLLRVVETGEYQSLGSDAVLRAQTVFLFATNRDLERDARDGRFPLDLWYRICRVVVTLPPLAERPEDIRPILEHYLRHVDDEAARRVGFAFLNRAGIRIDGRALTRLQQEPWPGNVRELLGVVARAASSLRPDETVVRARHVTQALERPVRVLPAAESLEAHGIRHVMNVLRDSGGNISEAARRLEISPGRIHRLLGRNGTPEPASEDPPASRSL
jgi:DNA-binding NtrC family response regulator